MAHAWKACWVQALGGSNPPSSATGPRDRFRFRGFCCVCKEKSHRGAGVFPQRIPSVALVRERSAKLGRRLSRAHPGCRRCWSARQVVAWTASLGRSDARAVGWRSDWAVLRVSRPRSLRLRGPPRSPHPAEPREARPSRRASSGAGPSRCNSTPSHTPSR